MNGYYFKNVNPSRSEISLSLSLSLSLLLLGYSLDITQNQIRFISYISLTYFSIQKGRIGAGTGHYTINNLTKTAAVFVLHAENWVNVRILATAD